MNQDNTVTLAVLSVLGTCVFGLIWVIKRLFTKIEPVLDNIKTATSANTKALDKLSGLTEANTKATQASDSYLRERNGRDSKAWAAVQHSLEQISTQRVEQQNIETQVVKSATVIDK